MSRKVFLALAVATFVLPLPEAAAQFMSRPPVNRSNRATPMQRFRDGGNGLRWRSLPLRQIPNGVVPVQQAPTASPQVVVGTTNPPQTVILQGSPQTQSGIVGAPPTARPQIIRFNGMALLRLPDGVEVPGYEDQYATQIPAQQAGSVEVQPVVDEPAFDLAATTTIHVQSPIDQFSDVATEEIPATGADLQTPTDIGVIEYVESEPSFVESTDDFDIDEVDLGDLEDSEVNEAIVDSAEISYGAELKTGTPATEATVVEQNESSFTIWKDVVKQTENWVPFRTPDMYGSDNGTQEVAKSDESEAWDEGENSVADSNAVSDDWDTSSEDWTSDLQENDLVLADDTDPGSDVEIVEQADVGTELLSDTVVDESDDWSDQNWSDGSWSDDEWSDEAWSEASSFADAGVEDLVTSADTSATESWDESSLPDVEVPSAPATTLDDTTITDDSDLTLAQVANSDATSNELASSDTAAWLTGDQEWPTDIADEQVDNQFDSIDGLDEGTDDWSDEQFDVEAWDDIDVDLPSDNEFETQPTELDVDGISPATEDILDEESSDPSWVEGVDGNIARDESFDLGANDPSTLDAEQADVPNSEQADFDQATIEEEVDAFAAADWSDSDETDWHDDQSELAEVESAVDGTTIATALTSGGDDPETSAANMEAAESADTDAENSAVPAEATSENVVAESSPFPWQWCLALGPLALLPIGYLWWKRQIAEDEEDYISATATPTRRKQAPAGTAPNAAVRTPATASPGVANSQAADSQPAAASSDDLTRLEGITPPVASLLNALGIRSFKKLATAKPEDLRAVITKGGLQNRVLDPAVWIQQAQFAARNDWENLAKWQSMNSHLFLAPGTKSASGGDDLTRIRGIDEPLAQHLASKGIKSYADLARNTAANLRSLLSDAGPNYARLDPNPWPGLASLASRGDWTKLNQLNTALEQGLLESTNTIFETLNRAVRPDQDPQPV